MGILPVLPSFLTKPLGGAYSPQNIPTTLGLPRVPVSAVVRLVLNPSFLDKLTFGIFGADTVIKHEDFREPVLKNLWGIANLDGSAAFTNDSCLSVKFTRSAKVSSFPVEKGSFGSFNKVLTPNVFKVVLSVSDNGQHKSERVKQLLTQLQDAVAGTTLYKVVTPDVVYGKYAVESFDYSRTQESGMCLVKVEISLINIREVEAGFTKVFVPKYKDATPAKDAGTVKSTTPLESLKGLTTGQVVSKAFVDFYKVKP